MTAPDQPHPGWCSPVECRAYAVGPPSWEPKHRSAPISMITDHPSTVMSVWLEVTRGWPDVTVMVITAEPDPDLRPWQIDDLSAEISLPLGRVTAVVTALLDLVQLARESR